MIISFWGRIGIVILCVTFLVYAVLKLKAIYKRHYGEDEGDKKAE